PRSVRCGRCAFELSQARCGGRRRRRAGGRGDPLVPCQGGRISADDCAHPGNSRGLTRFALQPFCPKGAAMLLAVDAGNTNLVFALVKDGEIRARWRIATDPRRTADEYAVWLHQLLELEGYDSVDVSAVIIGTVVPRALHNLEVL